MLLNPQFPADLVTFTEEVLNRKLHAAFRREQRTCFKWKENDIDVWVSVKSFTQLTYFPVSANKNASDVC